MANVNINFFWNPLQANVTQGTTQLAWNYIAGGSNWTSDSAGIQRLTTPPLYPGDTTGPNLTGGGSTINIVGTQSTTWKVPTTGPGSTVTVSAYICRGNNYGYVGGSFIPPPNANAGWSGGTYTASLTSNILVDLTSSNSQAIPQISMIGSSKGNEGPYWGGVMKNYTGSLTGGLGNIPPYPCKMYAYSVNKGAIANAFLYDYSSNAVTSNSFPTTGIQFEYIFSANAMHYDGNTYTFSMFYRNDSPWAWPLGTNWILTSEKFR